MRSIWVDADACPRPIKEVIFRAASRLHIPTVMIANTFLQKPKSQFISIIQVELGFDVADHEILKRLGRGDLVITQDVPLAAEVVDAGGYALNPRGAWYDKNSVITHLARRNQREELREAGLITGGPAPFSTKDTQAFAREFDQFLSRWS